MHTKRKLWSFPPHRYVHLPPWESETQIPAFHSNFRRSCCRNWGAVERERTRKGVGSDPLASFDKKPLKIIVAKLQRLWKFTNVTIACFLFAMIWVPDTEEISRPHSSSRTLVKRCPCSYYICNIRFFAQPSRWPDGPLHHNQSRSSEPRKTLSLNRMERTGS